MNNDGTKDLRDFYEMVDWFRSAEVSGGKVELLIAPKKGNAEERVITVGFQGGTSRDQISFSVTDGDYFDSVVLPKILDYYAKGDKYIENYELSNAELIGQTSKLTLETEGGNLVYLETYNPELLEEAVQNLEKKEEPQTVLTEYQKEWREIINCVKSRREVAQKYSSIGLSLEEVSKLSQVASFLSALPEFTPGYSEMSKKRIEQNLRMLLSQREYNEELRKIGIGEVQYQQVMNLMGEDFFQKRILRNDDTVMAWVKNIQAEKRINKSIERNSMTPDGYSKKKYEQYVERLEFATRELGKRTVNFYHLTNASYEQFELHEEDKNYGKNCAGAVASLKKSYEEESRYIPEEKLEQYRTYCDEVLEYLQQKAKIAYERKKKAIKDMPDITLEPYSPLEEDTQKELEEETNEYNDEESFENLMHSIELCKNARVGKENFEIIIEQDSKNPTKRYVRVALTNGVSRQDSFYFEFEDGNEFDTKIGEVLSATLQEDRISNFTKIPVLEAEEEKENALLTTKSGNEILFKVSRKLNEEVEEFLREKVNDTKENLAQETREEKEPMEIESPTEKETIMNGSTEETSKKENKEDAMSLQETSTELSPIMGKPERQALYEPRDILRTGWILASVLEKRENHTYDEEVDFGTYAKERDTFKRQSDYYEGRLTYMLNPEYTDFSPMQVDDEIWSEENSPTEEQLNPENPDNQDLMRILVELATAKKQLSESMQSNEQYLLSQKIRKAEMELVKWKLGHLSLENKNTNVPEKTENPLEASETNKIENTKPELSMKEKCVLVVEQLKKIAKNKDATNVAITPKEENEPKVDNVPTKEKIPQKVGEKTKSLVQQLKELKLTVVNSIKDKIKAIVDQIHEWEMVKNKEDWIQVKLNFNPGQVVDLALSSTLPASQTLTEKFTKDEVYQQLIPELAEVYTESNHASQNIPWVPQETGENTGPVIGQMIKGEDTMICIQGPGYDVLKTVAAFKDAIKNSKKNRNETPKDELEQGETLGKTRK